MQIQIECWKCHGKGFNYIDPYTKSILYYNLFNIKEICNQCNGNGHLNWIENIFRE